MAAHLDDLVHGGDDEDRAGARAVAAGRARPDRVLGDPPADQLLARRAGIAVAAPGRRREDLRRRLVHGVAQLADEDLRVERLVRQRRRADDAAAPALGAGVAVQRRFPGEVLDSRDAEVLGVLEVRRPEASHRLELHQEDVRDGGQDVEVLGVRQVVPEEEDVHEVDPPSARVESLERGRSGGGEESRHDRHRRRPGARELGRERDLRPFRDEVRGDQQADQEEDQPGVEGQVEALGAREGAAKDRHRHADEDQDLEDVLDERVDVARAAGQQHESRHEPFDHERDRADGQDEEAREERMWKVPA